MNETLCNPFDQTYNGTMDENKIEIIPLKGVDYICEQIKSAPEKPGVYLYYNQDNQILYVGKAKNLKKRLSSYVRTERLSVRIQRMVAQISALQTTITHTEAEALLLESNLIKSSKPPYNILLRDDKSFPYIVLGIHETWPRMFKLRLQEDNHPETAQSKKHGRFFGPFASATAVHETMLLLEKSFLLRTCPDTVFKNRSRPCLLYQLHRCAAPCVQKVSQPDYRQLVDQAVEFLSGKGDAIQRQLAEKMDEASQSENFEVAALYRDRIRALTTIQSSQNIHVQSVHHADVFALIQLGGKSCIHVLFYRNGRNYGGRSLFPQHTKDSNETDILASAIAQFYTVQPIPPLILTSFPLEQKQNKILMEALSLKANRSIKISSPHLGDKKKLIQFAENNAKASLEQQWGQQKTHGEMLERMTELFCLPSLPERIEVYDNSHISGSYAYGGMVVVGTEGFLKKDYRLFKIAGESMTPGDDYAMMREVINRRFHKGNRSHAIPDLVILDGGKGQLTAARTVLASLGLSDLPMIAISKGPNRHAGHEEIHMPDRGSFRLDTRDPLQHFLQRIRDEAHRFVIASHRKKRSSVITDSKLDSILGIGKNRKRALLRHFGSLRNIEAAGVSDLQKVEGISSSLAERIYHALHKK